MARPLKHGIDYFPLDVALDDKFELIEAVHGIAGFGIVIKLYQRIYANGYYLNVTEKEVLVLSKRVNVDINSIKAVIKESVKWGIFNQILYKEYGILTSKGIQKRYFEIVVRRKKVIIDERFLLVEHGLPDNVTETVNDDIIVVNDNINLINVDSGTQRESKGKVKGKRKESKEDNICVFSEAFEKWWRSYPKRNGRKVGKRKAAPIFNEIPKKDWDLLKEATLNYSHECNGLPKDAERFLRGNFWKDYLGKPKNHSPIKDSLTTDKKSLLVEEDEDVDIVDGVNLLRTWAIPDCCPDDLFKVLLAARKDPMLTRMRKASLFRMVDNFEAGKDYKTELYRDWKDVLE